MSLALNWCSQELAVYACRHWHYSKRMPGGKSLRIGVWEDGQFIGVVVFSRGATPNIGKPYGLTQYEICELTRIALTTHKAPVTKIVSMALKMLRQSSPGIKKVISYADIDEGHAGTIYRAGNWKYEGIFQAGRIAGFVIHGRKVHKRRVAHMGGDQTLEWVQKNLDPRATVRIAKGKHKFSYDLG